MASQTNYKVSDNGVERNASADEIQAIEDNQQMFQEDLAKQQQRLSDKNNAITKLEALGLTAEEIVALKG